MGGIAGVFAEKKGQEIPLHSPSIFPLSQSNNSSPVPYALLGDHRQETLAFSAFLTEHLWVGDECHTKELGAVM